MTETARDAGENVGSYATHATAAGAALANYSVTYLDGTLGINRRLVTITADNQSKHFGNADPALTYRVTSGGLAAGDVFSGGLTRVAGEPVGNYPILQGSVALNANYVLSYVPGTLAITNVAQVCEINRPLQLLWPPNHKMVPINPLAATSDADGDTINIRVNSIRQDEPTNDNGDGNTAIDGAGVGTGIAAVRAERTGDVKNPGNGRVYYIGYTASDAAGGSCSSTVTVGIPHDQSGKVQPIGDGPNFDSTVATVFVPPAPAAKKKQDR